MYIQSKPVMQFAARLGLNRYPEAVGLIVMLEELEAERLLNGMPDGLLFAALGGKPKGISRAALEESYAEYRKGMRREWERERKQRQRDSAQDEADPGTADGTTSGTADGTNGGTNGGTTSGTTSGTIGGTNGGTCAPSPLPLSPSPPFPPFPPAPPIPPIIPRNPVPQPPHPQKKSGITPEGARAGGASDRPDAADLGIDGAWRHGTRARGAAAQRLTDAICAEDCECGVVRDLYDVVYRALELGITPDGILRRARTQTGAQFASGIMSLECAPD